MLRLLLFVMLTSTLMVGNAQTTLKKNSSKAKTEKKTVPDLTNEIDQILNNTKARFEGLKNKWPITTSMFLRDIKSLASKGMVDKMLTVYYGDLESWRQATTIMNYIIGHYKTHGPGDIKYQLIAKHGQKAIYKGKEYTMEQLGNINYGVGMKAIGLPYMTSACAAGIYQYYSDYYLKGSSGDNVSKFLSAIKKANKNSELRGVCLDHKGDSKMIKVGYNWFK